MEYKNTGQVEAWVKMLVHPSLKYPALYFHQCCPWFIPWPVSSPNYRYTNQTGWSINSERRSSLISDLKKESYIKYWELWRIITDTLASNQDFYKVWKGLQDFFFFSHVPPVPKVQSIHCVFFFLGEEGEHSR